FTYEDLPTQNEIDKLILKFKFGGQRIESSLDGLNKFLLETTHYDKVKEKYPDIDEKLSITFSLKKSLKKAIAYKKAGKKIDSSDTYNLIKLNRLILEFLFPNECPKVSQRLTKKWEGFTFNEWETISRGK